VQDVHAISVILDHLRNAPHLALNPLEAVQLCVCVFGHLPILIEIP
jgi:hypothetical protein